MKRFASVVASSMIAVLALAGLPGRAYADCRDRDTAGKVIMGIAAVGLIAALASQSDAVAVDFRLSSSSCPPPPPPARWMPGHYETRVERIWIPGRWETVTTPAEYGWVRHGCRWIYGVVKPPCTRQVWVPERYEYRETRVWVDGYYEAIPGPPPVVGYARAW